MKTSKKPSRWPALTNWGTKLGVLVFDALLGGLCMYIAIQWRYQYLGKHIPNTVDENAAFIMVAIVPLVWIFTNTHKAIWRFTSLDDIRNLLQGVVITSALVPLILFLFFERAVHFPRSAPFIAGALFFLSLTISRLVVLMLNNGDLRALFRGKSNGHGNAILIGTGASIYNYLRDSTRKAGGAGFNILGLIDTDDSYRGRSIRGVPVLGSLDNLPSVYRRIAAGTPKPPMLISTEPNPDPGQAYDLVKTASTLGAPLARIGTGIDQALSPFEAADLIGRDVQSLDITPVRRLIDGKRVLITGAGGSIGSELARQIVALSPAKTVLVDLSEYNVYRIQHVMDEILPPGGETQWTAYLADVCDKDRMREIFEEEKPEIILHAAALKHVPLGESNPIETLRTNIVGTKTVIDLAIEFKSQSFTLISTDKAVSPNNIMGASKRVVEMLTMASEAAETDLSASAVRFGNVLASTGSVIPLFEEQIARGGPVTVTHKDVDRYFMTSEEAASLVLQAAALNASQSKNRASIYVLEMGQPVNIARLARQLIRLRGFVPDRDIKIKYTGLRPGEKLTERLTSEEENLESTYVKGVLHFTGDVGDPASVSRRVEKLIKAVTSRDRAAIKKALKQLVPEYEPNGGLS